MERLEVKEYHTIEELRREIRRTKDGRYSLRIQSVILRKEGKSTKEIEKTLQISRDTFSRWIHRYNEKGLEGLKDKKREGRKEKWGNELFKELFEELDENKGFWTIKKMQKFIEEKHKVKIPDESIRRKLHKVGYSWKSSRPSPYKGDREKQEEFKKKS